MRRRLRLAGAASVLCIATLGVAPAHAYPYTCSQVGNVWVGHQTNKSIYYGMFGYFTTYNPYVPNLNSTFSLSHLYIENASYFTSGTPTFVEVGWYKGYGPQLIASSPHYYTAFGDIYGYHEYDLADYPDANSSRLYEINYTGYNYTTAKYKWTTYAANLTTARKNFEVKNLGAAHPWAGGEINGGGASGTQMRTHGTPHQQLKDSGGVWHNWTPTYMSAVADSTAGCTVSGFIFTNTTSYEDFTAWGTKP